MQIGVLVTPTTPSRARILLKAVQGSGETAGLSIKTTTLYRPCDLLVMYGMGGADRYDLALKHVKGGGHLITWDAGYWGRKLPTYTRKYRFSLNGMHPPAYVMGGDSPKRDRLDSAKLERGNYYSPTGPVILAGCGPKSNAIGAEGWTAAMSKELRTRFPGRKILYRPKPHKPIEKGVVYDGIAKGAIDTALKGASLVVCRHSNVAVDACRLGIPVVCEDGAAAAIYPSTFHGKQPDHATREAFLTRLAYWQWSIDEIGTGRFWKWLQKSIPTLFRTQS